MSAAKQALVLHLVGGGEPVWIALAEDRAADLDQRLHQLVKTGQTWDVAGADGTTLVVNFAHVATAHIAPLNGTSRMYGYGQK
ncbi:hypothetical protein LX15_001795 [Streptoalloteichus tenebrarius]|uniref:Uncharacterized protein n=1 Tax=Streptoalloteichus tenebrarius (strain ATCC 17920 / DSM 40477 / JCM 4838 / CBS 697.72 / NBRC 16177 / NCIMB 11028 / NRRL B-12390 / A12253. 1 / ISP 5477) TaxID=1933 RepID=A0ABT1HRG9_STRSD|nr:hypothetical protein [Streptoalloteichus tenebrarius]MCP2258108.1 hypothetical protein [Streptoalloteichus tenebrarius]